MGNHKSKHLSCRYKYQAFGWF